MSGLLLKRLDPIGGFNVLVKIGSERSFKFRAPGEHRYLLCWNVISDICCYSSCGIDVLLKTLGIEYVN